MSTFKDINVTNTISIKEKPIYNHICDSYYDKYHGKLINIRTIQYTYMVIMIQ